MNELFSEEYAKKLENLARESAEKYKNGNPFPHIYFDDFLPIEAAEAALSAFPEPKQLTWTEFDKPTERKLAFDNVEKLPANVREVLFFLNSRPMLNFLEILTGIKGVIPDPYYVGGGLRIRSNPAAILRCTPTSICTPSSISIAASMFWSI